MADYLKHCVVNPNLLPRMDARFPLLSSHPDKQSALQIIQYEIPRLGGLIKCAQRSRRADKQQIIENAQNWLAQYDQVLVSLHSNR